MSDPGVALAMLPLLERGTEALRLKFANVPLADRPIGLTVDVVTEFDFIRYPALVLAHVCRNGTSTHILCASGVLCSLLERLSGKV